MASPGSLQREAQNIFDPVALSAIKICFWADWGYRVKVVVEICCQRRVEDDLRYEVGDGNRQSPH